MKRLALLRTSLASVLLWTSILPAHALGRLADIQVLDRDSGETLTVHRHLGEHWVAGRPDARYAVSIRNASSGRALAVVSVDGVNVVSGETAAWHQTGYVLAPRQQHAITGWRKSDTEVAAFHFTTSSASYAERTGRPAHVGVIGVAVFREKAVPPLPAVTPWPQQQEQEGSSGSRSSAPAGAADSSKAQSGSEGPRERAESLASRRMAPAAPAPRLGTGHGERETSQVSHTTFERRSTRPDELILIRYDSRENLIAMGVIPAQAVPPRPNPFPGGVAPGYAPDPS